MRNSDEVAEENRAATDQSGHRIDEQATVTASGNAVAEFRDYVNNDQGRFGRDHEYTSGALTRLIEATRSVADKHGHYINTDLNQAKEDADKITHDPQSLAHANHIRNAATAIAVALQNLQKAKFPQLNTEASRVKDAAADIDAGKETLNQKDNIRTFFTNASDLLGKMNS